MVLQPLPQPGNPCMCWGGGLVITEEEVCIQQSGMTYFVLFCWTQGALRQTKVSICCCTAAGVALLGLLAIGILLHGRV